MFKIEKYMKRIKNHLLVSNIKWLSKADHLIKAVYQPLKMENDSLSMDNSTLGKDNEQLEMDDVTLKMENPPLGTENAP